MCDLYTCVEEHFLSVRVGALGVFKNGFCKKNNHFLVSGDREEQDKNNQIIS